MQFHLLSFEGPDRYARAGGIATRITGLARALAGAGHDSHLWFVGDPDLPGQTGQDGVHLHRWCQWISAHHPGGVYDGEEGKRLDYVTSLPPFLVERFLEPALRQGQRVVILAEEWHTVDAVLHIDWLLRRQGLRERVTMLWNANNTYAFDRIDWGRFGQAATIITVSRYMKHVMWRRGVDPLVMPNGLDGEAFILPERDTVAAFRERARGRVVVSKVARWDPDKRWLLAVDTVKAAKLLGWRPLLLARGGVEAHGAEVLAAAATHGLRVVERECAGPGACGLLSVLQGSEAADIVSLRMPLDPEASRLLFHCSDAVLANSGHEPFGLVGLETMAAGGLACLGASGEDYAVPGHNALVLETNDPAEFVGLFDGLRRSAEGTRAMRQAARATAGLYRWPEIVQRVLLPRLDLLVGTAGRTAPASPQPATVSPLRRKGKSRAASDGAPYGAGHAALPRRRPHLPA